MYDFLQFSVVLAAIVIIFVQISKNPGAKAFSALPNASRAEFLKLAFDITPKDCETMRFDGRFFVHSRNVPYESYRAVRINGSKQVIVFNSSLPHASTWSYQRADGGPDRRYSGNSEIMHSNRCYVCFEGQRPFTLHVYLHPSSSNIESVIKKFDAFLCGAQEKNYEGEYAEFNEAFEAMQVIQAQRGQLLLAAASCKAIIDSHGKMKNMASVTDGIETMAQGAEAARAEIANKLERLDQLLQEYGSQKSSAVQLAKLRSEMAANFKIMGLAISNAG